MDHDRFFMDGYKILKFTEEEYDVDHRQCRHIIKPESPMNSLSNAVKDPNTAWDSIVSSCLHLKGQKAAEEALHDDNSMYKKELSRLVRHCGKVGDATHLFLISGSLIDTSIPTLITPSENFRPPREPRVDLPGS